MKESINSVSIYAGDVETCYCVGQGFITEIKKEPRYIDGDAFEHYVIYLRGEVKATIRCLYAHEVTYNIPT